MLQKYVARVSYGCCKRDVAYVAMVYTRMLQTCVPNVSYVFETYVASVFIWMLLMFHTYIVSVLFGCCVYLQCFSSIFYMFLQVLRHTFQVFHLSSFVYYKYCIWIF
jgi:hypothetical protein